MRDRAAGTSWILIAAGALALAAAACGARGSLPLPGAEPEGAGGSGTGTGTGTGPGTGTGTGGAGGAPSGFCPTLVAVEPTLELDSPGPSLFAAAPALLRLPDGRVLVLAAFGPIESPGPAPRQVQGLVIDPWDAWPPAPGPYGVFDDGADDVPFQARRERQAGTIALLLQRFASPCWLAAHYGVSPDAPPGPAALELLLTGTCDERPIAATTAGNGLHFVANDLSYASSERCVLAGLYDDSGGIVYNSPFCCATTPIVGDVLPREQRFLFAHAAAEGDTCFMAPGSPPLGPARRLVLRRIDADGEGPPVEVFQGNDDLVDVRLLPRSEGEWLLTRESGASAEVAPPGIAMRLGPGDAVGQPFEVTTLGIDRMAAASLDDGFVTAYTDSFDPSAPTVILRVFSPEGQAAAEASFPTNEAWIGSDRLALLGSPGARSVLVAWVGHGSNASEPGALRLRRYDCVGEE